MAMDGHLSDAEQDANQHDLEIVAGVKAANGQGNRAA